MPNRRMEYIRGFGMLLLIAVVGLFIAKWQPYFQRTLTIFSTHAYPGSSIVAGKEAAPPVASFQAALAYGQAYFLAIWQALVVGLLLYPWLLWFLVALAVLSNITAVQRILYVWRLTHPKAQAQAEQPAARPAPPELRPKPHPTR